MATKLQRAEAIMNALTDGTAPPAVVGRALDAFATFAGENPANLTQAQKAGLFLRAVRDYVRSTVQDVEIRAAERTARQAINPPDLGTD